MLFISYIEIYYCKLKIDQQEGQSGWPVGQREDFEVR